LVALPNSRLITIPQRSLVIEVSTWLSHEHRSFSQLSNTTSWSCQAKHGELQQKALTTLFTNDSPAALPFECFFLLYSDIQQNFDALERESRTM